MKYVLFLLAGSFLLSCNAPQNDETVNAENNSGRDSTELIEYGGHLVAIAGCNDCHSPKNMSPTGFEIKPETMLSGYPADRPVFAYDKALAQRGIVQMNEDMTAAAGPWGVSFAANLTSDGTGAASWPLENFKKAMRTGKMKGVESSRMMLPPMPWFNYVNMTDEELEAIYAYLRSVPPIKNTPPDPISPMP